MKTLNVLKYDGCFSQNNCEKHSIDIVNWKDYPYQPEVFFQIAYDDDNLYLCYEVKEDCIRAREANNNGKVWLDSCVEFFISPEGNDEYYNFECNCIGTKLLGFHKPGIEAEHATSEILYGIQTISSLGNLPFEEKTGGFSWSMEAKIPWKSFWNHQITDLKEKKMKANFYKCGDELSKPHFLSWNPIQTDQPSFHQPGFFGELHF